MRRRPRRRRSVHARRPVDADAHAYQQRRSGAVTRAPNAPHLRWARRTLALAGALVLLAAAGCALGRAPAPSPPVSSISPSASGVASAQAAAARLHALDARRARLALRAFLRAFYVRSGWRAWFAMATFGGQAAFYRNAEMIELVEDAYRSTGRAVYRRMVVRLMNGVTAFYGTRWTTTSFNDDVLWMVIAAIRAYEITGHRAYLAAARQNFDTVYARGWSGAYGGGLWWDGAGSSKNVTTNAPAVIAACLLARDLHAPSYLAKARRLYAWTRRHLYDAATGAVYDSILSGGAVNEVDLTYNYGTLIGAASLLYQATGRQTYYGDALRALTWARGHVTNRRGVLQAEPGGPDSNPGGFKGIFCRYALGFARGQHITSFDAWFQANADAAWRQRNAAGLIGTFWSRPTMRAPLYAWDCSSAVVLLQVLAER
jgi:predicted alpha-1,6-mannanase (GH76 family)